MGRRTHPLPLELLLPIGPKELSFYFLICGPDATCGNIFERWQITDLPDSLFFLFLKRKKEKKETKIPTLDSYTHYYNYKHLFPKHDHRRKEKKEKRKKKRGSIVQISPRGTHNYNRMQTYLYSTLYSSFLFRSFSLSLSHYLSLSLTLTHTHRPRNPRIPMLSCSDLCWKSVLVQCRFGESRRFLTEEVFRIRKWRLRRRAPSTSRSSRMSSTRFAKSSTLVLVMTFSKSFKE